MPLNVGYMKRGAGECKTCGRPIFRIAQDWYHYDKANHKAVKK